MPVLVTALIDKEPRTRAAATKCLVLLKPPPALLMPAIGKIIEAANADAMNNIVEAVADVGALRGAGLGEGGSSKIRSAPRVAAILGRLGPDAKDAAPALAGILEKDKSPSVRREALIAHGFHRPIRVHGRQRQHHQQHAR